MSNKEHYGNIYMSIKGTLASIASRIAPPKDIEDIVQESYVRLCQAKHHDEIREPHAFLKKTVRNLSLDYVKRAESRLASGMEDEDEFGFFGRANNDEDRTYEQVSRNEKFAFFCESVRQLPVKCRRVFVLKKVYGYTQKEISEELGISENTVEKHIVNGIKKCRYYMMQQEQKSQNLRKTSATTQPKQEKNHE